MSDLAAPIELAHESDYTLGLLSVRPSTREVVRNGSAVEVLEPRVMQVLVALSRAGGAIVSRNDLTQSCWNGRVVGEDAINRVISRLRRTAEGLGAGAFRIETVTKVGYRLVQPSPAPQTAAAIEAEPVAPETRRLPLGLRSRRGMLTAGAGAAIALTGATRWWAGRTGVSEPPAAVASLMMQAELALAQDTREGQNQAIGLYQQVTATEPRYADGWGALAVAYACSAPHRAANETTVLRARAHAAATRARTLDPDNAFAHVAEVVAQPRIGSWLARERVTRMALQVHPENPWFAIALAYVLGSVGRCDEAAAAMETIARVRAVDPNFVFTRTFQLWAAQRQEEADVLMAQGARLFPTHFAVWFSRFYVLLYTGRPSAALAMAADRGTWPTGIPESEIARIARVATAAQTRDPAAIDAVVADSLAQARLGSGLAENAMSFVSLFGRVDEAFAIAEAYYFGRNWVVPDVRFTTSQGSFLAPGDQQTQYLFYPVTAPMRQDPRFAGIVRELGIEDYWRRSGTMPDYRRA